MKKNVFISTFIVLLVVIFASTSLAQKPEFGQYNYEDYVAMTGKTIEDVRESPTLTELVQSGMLPSLAERLPGNLVVVVPRDEVGNYGGELVVPAEGIKWEYDAYPARGQGLLKLDPDLNTVVPNIAERFELNEDATVLTVHLREGLRWSDGEFFTADDFVFWYEDIFLNDDLTPIKPVAWVPGGEPAVITKLGDYAVQFSFAVPYPIIINRLTSGYFEIPYAPKHYLSQFHINYNPNAGELAKSEGFSTWWESFEYHNLRNMSQQDPDRPSFDSWVLDRITTTEKIFRRNPYYWKIDTEGNQLPYIDVQRVVFIEDSEVRKLRVRGGEFSYGGVEVAMGLISDTPFYQSGEALGDYTTIMVAEPLGSEFAVAFNPTVDDPIKRGLFNDIRFKQAMSLAIDRDEINDTFFYGMGIPRQGTTPPDTSYYEEWMGEHCIEYDVERANELLDELGMKWNSAKEYRLGPDGKPFSITIRTPRPDMADKLDLVVEYWGKVGIQTDYQIMQRSLFLTAGEANQNEASAFIMGGNADEVQIHATAGELFRPPWGVMKVGYPWWAWHESNGKSGEEPPEHIKHLINLTRELQTKAAGTDDYLRIGKEILTINLENLYYIGTVGMVPSPVAVKNALGNAVRTGDTWTVSYFFLAPCLPEQWYWR